MKRISKTVQYLITRDLTWPQPKINNNFNNKNVDFIWFDKNDKYAKCFKVASFQFYFSNFYREHQRINVLLLVYLHYENINVLMASLNLSCCCCCCWCCCGCKTWKLEHKHFLSSFLMFIWFYNLLRNLFLISDRHRPPLTI